jgi:hypothetical protein
MPKKKKPVRSKHGTRLAEARQSQKKEEQETKKERELALKQADEERERRELKQKIDVLQQYDALPTKEQAAKTRRLVNIKVVCEYYSAKPRLNDGAHWIPLVNRYPFKDVLIWISTPMLYCFLQKVRRDQTVQDLSSSLILFHLAFRSDLCARITSATYSIFVPWIAHSTPIVWTQNIYDCEWSFLQTTQHEHHLNSIVLDAIRQTTQALVRSLTVFINSTDDKNPSWKVFPTVRGRLDLILRILTIRPDVDLSSLPNIRPFMNYISKVNLYLEHYLETENVKGAILAFHFLVTPDSSVNHMTTWWTAGNKSFTNMTQCLWRNKTNFRVQLIMEATKYGLWQTWFFENLTPKQQADLTEQQIKTTSLVCLHLDLYLIPPLSRCVALYVGFLSI